MSCGDATCNTDRERKMVAVAGGAFCDPCIAPLIGALNDGGIKTIASCCGHGRRPASVALADGRFMIVARDFAEFQKISALFPTDINGDPFPPPSPITNAEEKR